MLRQGKTHDSLEETIIKRKMIILMCQSFDVVKRLNF